MKERDILNLPLRIMFFSAFYGCCLKMSTNLIGKTVMANSHFFLLPLGMDLLQHLYGAIIVRKFGVLLSPLESRDIWWKRANTLPSESILYQACCYFTL